MAILISSLEEVAPWEGEVAPLLENILAYGLELHGKSGAEVSLVLVNNHYIQELNKDYRGIDAPTDVLSFALTETAPDEVLILPEELPESLGDIYLSVEKAQQQAVAFGHSIQREICYLAAHGLLHLLGFDHQNDTEKELMRLQEERLLAEFDLARPGKKED